MPLVSLQDIYNALQSKLNIKAVGLCACEVFTAFYSHFDIFMSSVMLSLLLMTLPEVLWSYSHGLFKNIAKIMRITVPNDICNFR